MPDKLSIKCQDIAGSEFETLNLAGAKFTDINLSGAQFHDINFSDVLFTAAQIGGTTFKHIGPPPDKDGKQARQRPVTFEDMQLGDSLFRNVDLSGVQVIGCDLAGMTIDGLLVTDLLQAWKDRNA
jgi:uncharacterized protein YjbI with pentapeptide repeats